MIRQEYKIEGYDWRVYAYYAVSTYYTDEIMQRLFDIGCGRSYLRRAYNNLISGKLDSGITYSNYDRRETVMVIALTSTPKEFAKSWQHEMGHLATHIAEADGLDPYGEEIQYLGDDIIELTWEIAHNFLCSCQRKKLLE